MNGRDDREFIRWLRETWGRPELSAAEAARFDRELRDRVEGGRRTHWIPVAALAAAGAAIALVIVTSGRQPAPPEGLSLVEVLAQAQEIAYGDGLSWEPSATDKESASDSWPNDYDPNTALNTILSDEYRALAFLVAPPGN